MNHQLAYNWLAEMLQRNQRPEIASPIPMHPLANMGIPQGGGLAAHPTMNWVSPLAAMPRVGQADYGALRKLRGF